MSQSLISESAREADLPDAQPEFYRRLSVYAPPVAARVSRPLPLPSARDWARHSLFFLLTILTTTTAGILLASQDLTQSNAMATLPAAATWTDAFRLAPVYVSTFIGDFFSSVVHYPQLIRQGLTFSAALLAILLAHEAGHYIACRYYRVRATLPYFLPAPPFFTGTFGAFIKIKSPIPSRRALFDIGVAGPIAGFLVIIPVAVLAVLTAHPAPAMSAINADGASLIIFHEPLLFQIIQKLFGETLGGDIAFNPFFYAAWIGLLVTSLNLMPVGQLDGGHAVFSIFGARLHKWVGRAAFLTVATLAVFGWTIHHAPSGFVYTLLLLVMLRVRHPHTDDDHAALERPRIALALATLLIFILSFLPFPITVV